MKVYVVFHADIEDDRYVRAVCSTLERAEAVRDTPQPCEEGHVGYLEPWNQHTRRSPTWYRDTNTELEPADEWSCYHAHDHFTRNGTQESLCCSVEEWEVDGVNPRQVVSVQSSPLNAIMEGGGLNGMRLEVGAGVNAIDNHGDECYVATKRYIEGLRVFALDQSRSREGGS